VPMYLSARGLSSSAIHHAGGLLDFEFDFVDHRLAIRTSDGAEQQTPLEPRTVADFHADVLRLVRELDVAVEIDDLPTEIPDPIRFHEDRQHASYDADAAHRFWQVLASTDRAFKRFQTGFLGKSSPVHFFWGSFDLAVTRFSGETAPPHPGGIPHLSNAVVREAYSHAVSSAGFWPGGAMHPEPIYYSYAYPAPEGFAAASVEPAEAGFHEGMGEFVLPYEAVRTADDPEAALAAFLQTTYDAAADLGGWDRDALDCEIGRPGVPREVP